MGATNMEKLTGKDFGTDFLGEKGTSRRVFIKGVGLVSAALVTGLLGGCERLADAIRNRPIRRRLRTGSPEVDAAIDIYRDAVAAMKALPASDPRSWAAQAAIHGTVSGGFNFCEHNTDHFFDWHRAYLFYFEKICQKLTNNPKFGLPYWNWNQNLDVHPAFTDSSSTLFLARTRNSMSGSFAVTNATLDPIFADTNFFTFRQQLEGTPHNTVHTYIGGTMGSGGSALDPLFWMHHCMVDYCWYKWNIDLNNDNPNAASWINHENSHFVDANGDPASSTAGVTTLMPLLAYQYESSPIGSSVRSITLGTKGAYRQVERRIREGADIRFDVRQRVRLADRMAVTAARPMAVATRLSSADFAQLIEGEGRAERVFASIRYAQLPRTNDFAVRVFVNLPSADASTPIDDPHYAGSFSFFGSPPAGVEASPQALSKHTPQFLVDLTETIRRLRQRQELRADGELSLQLVAVPFGEDFASADTELVLDALEIITTPVVIRSGEG